MADLFTATNSISSSSISREGNSFYTMKLIPLSYRMQMNSKALVSIIITIISLIISIIFASIYFKLGLFSILLIIVCILSTIKTSYMGILLDAMNPKLVWDDEINALRGNKSVFINMSISIMASILLVGLIFLLKIISIPFIFKALITILIMLVSIFITYKLCMNKGEKYIVNIE